MHVFYAPDIVQTMEPAGGRGRTLSAGVAPGSGRGDYPDRRERLLLSGGHFGCHAEALCGEGGGETEQEPFWKGHLHLALAPTKNMDRMEWLAEKATEIGFDELTFLNCRFSERKVIKTERVEKIVVSAVKQSLKARKPVVNEMTDFRRFMEGGIYGAEVHCALL